MDIIGEVQGMIELNKKIQQATAEIKDLTPVLLTIMADWYKDNEEIFMATEGPGLYEDLSPDYFEYKETNAPNGAYPILEFDGYLKSSLTNPSDGSSYHVITPQSLVMGTLISYAGFHQSSEPRTKMPYRPFIFNKSAYEHGDEGVLKIHESRNKRYMRALDTYVQRRLRKMYPKGNGGDLW